MRKAIFFALGASVLAGASRLDRAVELQRAGKLQEANREFQAAIVELRASGDRAGLAKALSIESWVSVSLGNNRAAIEQATEAVLLRHDLRDEKHVADDLNTIALANQNLGNYSAALGYYQEALAADRRVNDAEGEITRLNNIGNIYYFQGRYLDALRSYEQAKSKVAATSSEPWNPRRRQLTLANLAAVYQRLGKEEVALDLYRHLAASPQEMPPRERGQFLLNQGALYRRLGDPVKALDTYRAAQRLFAVEHYNDGEIGALRNIGIVRAIDLHNLDGALEAFSAALKLAENSSNRRGLVQAHLYRGETFRRMHRRKESETDARAALDEARSAGLIEEQWRALFLLGRLADKEREAAAARQYFLDAITVIESIRAGIRDVSLRNEFLADKRDVYDALIELRLKENAPVDELFRWIEQSRARTLGDRAALASFQSIEAIHARLPPDSVVLEYWCGPDSAIALWISRSGAGAVRSAQVDQDSRRLIEALESGAEPWRDLSRKLGDALLSNLPVARHVIVVPDGPLGGVPFEVLTLPGTSRLLIEQSDVSYLPSTQFLARSEPVHRRLAPWRAQMIALGDPPVEDGTGLAEGWQRLPASAEEVRSISRILPGRLELHLGADAGKHWISGRGTRNVPMLHLSTHAVIDPENPDRSRILLASDYLFQGEVYDLNLKDVDLVTLSACETARGKTIRGEGVQAFSQAFLAAGAAATVTSLWRVSDQSTAAFMKQFYYFLARGETKSEALRSAKLAMLGSGSALANPRHWAAFELTGNGWTPIPLVVPMSAVLLACGAAIAVLLFAVRVAQLRQRKAAPSIASSRQ